MYFIWFFTKVNMKKSKNKMLIVFAGLLSALLPTLTLASELTTLTFASEKSHKKKKDPLILCSHDFHRPSLLPTDQPCPASCPYSQKIEGGTCEKVCVAAKMCGAFFPARSFADEDSMRCTAPCGRSADNNVIEGCVACSEAGVCKRCATGLLGLSWYELSEDGSQCYNNAQYGFRMFLYVVLGLVSVVAELVSAVAFPWNR